MNYRHSGESQGNGSAVPRDLPDQHARPGEDPLDVDVEGLGSSGDTDDPDSGPRPDPDPDPDSDSDSDSADDPDSADESGWSEPSDARDESGQDLPDTDEAGAGRRGTPRTGGAHPEQPVPDEPSG